ncbi:hypothetical protein MC885_006190, partial [Smutsia gigantea]
RSAWKFVGAGSEYISTRAWLRPSRTPTPDLAKLRLHPPSLSPILQSAAPRPCLFSLPGRPWQLRCSGLDAMGLPEERGRSGSGTGVQEEVESRNRTRSWSPPPLVSRSAHVSSLQRYRELHRRSLEEPREFWGDIAKEFYWKTSCPGPFLQYNFDVTKGKIFIEWMKGATTNICYNVLDRIVHEKKL